MLKCFHPAQQKMTKDTKKNVYEQCGVREYWLVDPVNKSVEQYILQNNKFELHEIYFIYPDFMLEDMSEEERAAIITEFKCSLYDDLIIKLEDIFKRVV